MNTNHPMRFMCITIILAITASLSLGGCRSEDACQNYNERCAEVDESLCADVLEGQSQSVIRCVYFAATCGGVHKCFDVNESDTDSNSGSESE